MIKRIVSFFLVFSILFSCLPFCVSASQLPSGGTLVPAEYYYDSGSQSNWLFLLWQGIYRVAEVANDVATDMLDRMDNLGTIELYARKSGMYCQAAANSRDKYAYAHKWVGGFSDTTVACKYCGITVAEWNESKGHAEKEFISSLAQTISLPFHLDPSHSECFEQDKEDGYLLSYSLEPNSLQYVIGKYSYKPNYRTEYHFSPFDSKSCSNASIWHLWYSDSFHVAADDFYEITFPSVLFSCGRSLRFSLQRFVDNNWVFVEQFDFTSLECYEDLVLDTNFFSGRSYTYEIAGGYDYRFFCSLSSTSVYTDSPGTLTGVSGLVLFTDLLLTSTDGPGTTYDPEDPEQADDERYDETSRSAYLMDLLAEFNSLNSYLDDDSAVNMFLGKVDSEGNITGVFEPSVFDEETLVFTEPVTGAQYQTSGWTYDYYTRSYNITLEPGTLMVGNREVSRIVLIYDDESVFIRYYSEDGTVLSEEEFSYVMVSQSSCSLEGHSYSVETTKEASCTAMGERVYTCSVCGDQKVEDIPMKEHRVSHSVFKEATCRDPGYAFYTCMDCGTQYSEPIPALGHDWISDESVETDYMLPSDATCPVCASVSFSTVLDKVAVSYNCTCNGCGAQWLEPAQVIHGYTAYICSRCGARKTESNGENDNGLFASIGNFVADGIRWCTDKLSQFVDGLTGMLDTFIDYLNQIGENNSSYPSFLGKFVAILPEDMMAVIWFLIVAAVVVAVIKFWFR